MHQHDDLPTEGRQRRYESPLRYCADFQRKTRAPVDLEDIAAIEGVKLAWWNSRYYSEARDRTSRKADSLRGNPCRLANKRDWRDPVVCLRDSACVDRAPQREIHGRLSRVVLRDAVRRAQAGRKEEDGSSASRDEVRALPKGTKMRKIGAAFTRCDLVDLRARTQMTSS